MKPLRYSRWAPWGALAAAAFAATLNQQLLGDMLRFDCRLGRPSTGVLVGLCSLAILAAGSTVSWLSVRGEGGSNAHDSNRRFVAHLALSFAALLAVMIVWQVFATFAVPPCPD
ncbi:MAG TPA: hypothetical protein VNS57_07960 [Steroidobacteraceae bacterium]|nr:hypothetical protein [Steroidobacteraceae bacterium]